MSWMKYVEMIYASLRQLTCQIIEIDCYFLFFLDIY